MAGHMQMMSRTITAVTALVLGIERTDMIVTGTGMDVEGNVDVMFAGGTTARGREFFDVQLAIEMLAMWTHTGPEPFDINGRHTARGITYDFTVVTSSWAVAVANYDTICALTENRADFLNAMADGVTATGGAWGNLDNIVYHGALILKFFQVFPPPGPGEDPCPACPVPEIIIDNLDEDVSFTGIWSTSSATGPWAGNSVYCNSGCTFRWTSPVTFAGDVEVFVWFTWHSNRSSVVPYIIEHGQGSDVVVVDQLDQSLSSQWLSLGVYPTPTYVEVSSSGGQASADAVKYVEVP
jgi:hypothetical protein